MFSPGLKYAFSFFTALAVLVLFHTGCSTKKNTLVGRGYHNLTARYNGYFNAKLKVKEGADNLARSHEDRYDRTLSVFRYGDAEKSKAVHSLMDEAIKKSSVVIQRHSMFIKGEEHCRWIDDNYLLIGQARFYKYDFYSALETFQYVAGQYNKEPIRFDAILWMVKTNLQLKKYSEAEGNLDFLRNEQKLPSYLQEEFHATSADFFVIVKNYPKAIEELTKALVLTRKRYTRARYAFILAQLYQKQGEQRRAYNLYQQVIKLNPPYEMAFNAQINMAQAFDTDGQDSKEIKKQLTRMLKDEKNKEYLDQIYYAFGSLCLKEKNDTAAIRYFTLSTRTSIANTNQKALSFLELGKIYFDRPDYKLAQAYYDSTVSFLSKDHPDYDKILQKKNVLTRLIKNLNIILTEDSLQRLSLMSKDQLDKYLSEIIEKQKADLERKKKEEEALKAQNALMSIQNSTGLTTPGASSTGGAWYFYNPSTLSFGYSDFLKRWGNRKLEDHWRRSNKEMAAPVDESSGEVLPDSVSTIDTYTAEGLLNKENFIKTLPYTPEQKKQSDQRIVESYYALSSIYKEELLDLPEAAKNFEELQKRFPGNKYQLPAWYQLYRIYLSTGKAAQSEYYKNQILEKYPDSEYANLIKNPGYLKEGESRVVKLREYYKETYKAFYEGRYAEVIERKSIADTLFVKNELAPKFDYLKTLSIGKTNTVEEFEASLNGIVKKYPSDPVRESALNILDYIASMKSKNSLSVSPTSITSPAPALYSFRPDTTHRYIIMLPGQPVAHAKRKIKVMEYNAKMFPGIAFEAEVMTFDSASSMLVVKPFPDLDNVLAYFTSIKDTPEIFSDLKPGTFHCLFISDEDFLLLIQRKDLSVYLDGFKAKYGN